MAQTLVFLGTSALLLSLTMTAYTKQSAVLDEIKQKGELVVVTRNSPTTYYVGPNGPTGPEYDLISRFASHLGVKLRLVTTDNLNNILAMIERHEAHLAAAGLTVTEDRKDRVRFGPPYQNITQQLVYRAGTKIPHSPEDLIDSRLEVIAGSSHIEGLKKLAQHYPDLTWHENSVMESDELLSYVWERRIDYTIADSNEVVLNQRFYPELRVAFDITGPQQLAWALPKDTDNGLYNEAVKFFDLIRKNGEFNQIMERHYGHVQDFDYVGTRKFMRHISQRLPAYVEQFQQAAEQHNLDWRLLAAIGYQESHWNPQAISPTGVRGIMMLTRTTAEDMGYSNRIDPQNSINGGARYFSQLKNRIPQRIAEPDRTWFALAAYNIGLGHVENLRVITQRRGGNPDKWVDVKANMQLIMQNRWHDLIRHGYARGKETLQYVENIRGYYDILVRQTEYNRQALTKKPVTYPVISYQDSPSPLL